MLHLTYNNLVSSIHILFPKRSSYKVDTFSSTFSKNNFVVLFSTYMFLNRNACILVFIGYILTHAVNSTVNVGVLRGVAFYNGINHMFRLLGSSTVIEIN